MRIPAHAHVVCSLLERRAVVPTMRLRVYSGRFVIFSNLNSMEGNMRLRKVCPQCNTILHARRSVKDIVGIVEPPRIHVIDLYTPCLLCTEVVREGSKRFTAVEPPGTSV